MRTIAAALILFPLLQAPGNQPPEVRARLERQTVELRAILRAAPKSSLEAMPIKVTPPRAGWEMAMVSWVASDKSGLIYLLQRGDKADPVVVLKRDGTVVRSWGKGMYVMPHAIRVDPHGDVWTTDAASSMVTKFSPDGRTLMQIEVGGQPSPCNNNFCSTTDIAFAPNGHLYVSDGYANARILEYTADGKKIRQWGEPGTGPGQFRLPHSIQIDDKGIVYVADRENGRIQRFDLQGTFLGEWDEYGKTFGMSLQKDGIWLSTQPRRLPNSAPGWLIEIDRTTGKVLHYIESAGNHGMEVMTDGTLLQAPGRQDLKLAGYSDRIPQMYRPPRLPR